MLARDNEGSFNWLTWWVVDKLFRFINQIDRSDKIKHIENTYMSHCDPRYGVYFIGGGDGSPLAKSVWKAMIWPELGTAQLFIAWVIVDFDFCQTKLDLGPFLTPCQIMIYKENCSAQSVLYFVNKTVAPSWAEDAWPAISDWVGKQICWDER